MPLPLIKAGAGDAHVPRQPGREAGYHGVPALKAPLGQLVHQSEVDAARIGAVGFCPCGSVVLTWACTDNRLAHLPKAVRR
jgi:dienelactone hydrolase